MLKKKNSMYVSEVAGTLTSSFTCRFKVRAQLVNCTGVKEGFKNPDAWHPDRYKTKLSRYIPMVHYGYHLWFKSEGGYVQLNDGEPADTTLWAQALLFNWTGTSGQAESPVNDRLLSCLKTTGPFSNPQDSPLLSLSLSLFFQYFISSFSAVLVIVMVDFCCLSGGKIWAWLEVVKTTWWQTWGISLALCQGIKAVTVSMLIRQNAQKTFCPAECTLSPTVHDWSLSDS